MNQATFSPSANFTPSADVPHNIQAQWQNNGNHYMESQQLQASAWSTHNSTVNAMDTQRNIEFAARSQFSDHNRAIISESRTMPQQYYFQQQSYNTGAIYQQPQMQPMHQAPLNMHGAQTRQFVPSCSEFVPSATLQAPTFVPSAPIFQPTSNYASPASLNAVQSKKPKTKKPKGDTKSSQVKASSSSPSETKSVAQSVATTDADGNSKTELCKNWIETAKCRYQDECRYAHGQHELTIDAIQGYNSKFKSKNCRTFYNTKQCMFGANCMFRHEHRNYSQLHRHYYTPQMYKLELLLKNEVADGKSQIGTYDPATHKLPIFDQIHALIDSDESTQSESQSEAELSETELNQDVVCNQNYSVASLKLEKNDSNSGQSCLNTTFDSEKEDFAQKFGLQLCLSPALLTPECSDTEMGDDSDCGDIEVSPLSLGLDFV